MDPGRILIRCLASFIFLLALIRISGKRTVSQGTAFDFVLSLILGDLVDDAIFAEVPLTNFFVAIGTLVIIEVTATILVHRSERWLWWLEGRARVMLEAGKLNSKALKDEQLNERDVACLLRLHGLEKEKWIQVKSALMEADGEGSILKRTAMKSAQKKDRKWLHEKNA